VDWPEKKALTNLSSFYLYFADVDQTKRSDRLQARLAAAYRSVQIPELKKRLSPGTVARMESRASRATTLLWKAYPLTQEFALTDEEVRFSVAYATGQRLDMPDRCSCARGIELTMEHTVYCAEKLTRHNMIQDRFVAFARFHGVHTRQNVRLPNQDADARLEPDVIFYPGTFGPVQTDITVINPCAPFRLKHHRNAHKWATTTKKREKERKYLAKAQEKGDSFKPLVFETHGKMDKEIYNLLEMLATRTTFDRGLAVTDMKLDLAVTLARGNALAARTTIARAQRARDSTRAVHPLPAASSSSSTKSKSRFFNRRTKANKQQQRQQQQQ